MNAKTVICHAMLCQFNHDGACAGAPEIDPDKQCSSYEERSTKELTEYLKSIGMTPVGVGQIMTQKARLSSESLRRYLMGLGLDPAVVEKISRS